MYVCPSCSEQIPDRVRKANDECPFCHSPFPPEEAGEAVQTPAPETEAEAKPAGWGEQARPAPASGPAATAEPPRSKVGLVIVLLVVVLGAGAGLYFGVLRKSGGKQSGGSASEVAASEDLDAAARFYKGARKVLFEYAKDTCKPFHEHGFAYQSHLSPVTKIVKRGQKQEKLVTFRLVLKPDPNAKAAGPLDIFACPARLATLHRDHPFVIQAKIWEKRRVFGAVQKIADMELQGKLLGYLKQKKFRSLAAQTPKGFFFPALKSAPDPGLQALGQPLPFHMATDAKSFTLSNMTWKKTAPGKYIQGTWRMEMRTTEIKDQFDAWAQGCEMMKRRKLAKLSRPKKGHALHKRVFTAVRKVARDYCRAMEKMDKALDPWRQADVDAASSTLQAAKKRWETEVRRPILQAAKKLNEAVLLKPL